MKRDLFYHKKLKTLRFDIDFWFLEEILKLKNKEEYTQLTLFDYENTTVEYSQEKWADGSIVKNICNNKEYTVKNDDGNIIEVFDKDRGYLIMARSDLEYLEEKNKSGVLFG